MKSEKVPRVQRTIMEALDAILDSFKTRFNLQFSALPLHYTRVTEKFDAIENYRIRDGF